MSAPELLRHYAGLPTHEFLLRGDVFDADVIEAWIDWKRKNDVDAIRTRPHPYEFEMYYDT